MAGSGTMRRIVGLFVALVLVAAAAPARAAETVVASDSSDPIAPTALLPTVEVQARQSGLGWRAPVTDGGSSGGDGSGLGLTGLRVTYDAASASGIGGGVVYQLADTAGTWGVECAGDGTPSTVPGGIGAIRAHLTGEAAERFDLAYRVSVPSAGWRGWALNGEEAGAIALGRPIEALSLRLVPKGGALPASSEADPLVRAPSLAFGGYVSGVGVMDRASGGAVYGVEGRPLHDLFLSLEGNHRLPGGVSYRVRTGSWQPWVTHGSACPVDPNAPICAIEARLEGACADYFDLWYRVHAQGIGWLGWTRNGASAGTVGLGTSADQVQLSLLPKGSPAPGDTQGPFLERVAIATVLGNIANAPGGLSGFGGGNYDPSSSAGTRLRNAIAQVTAGGKQLAFVMADLTTGKGIAYNADSALYVASSIKGPYVIACNKFHPNQVSPAVRATMSECITISCDDCYRKLRAAFGPQTIADLQAYVGGCSFTPYTNFPWITAKDLAKLWVGGYNYFTYEPNANAAWCRDLFTRSYNSFIRSALGWKATTYTKPGWINFNATYLARNDAGIVMDGDRPYVVAILSNAYGRDGALEELTRAIDDVHGAMVR